jgi:hypothetical protein
MRETFEFIISSYWNLGATIVLLYVVADAIRHAIGK